MASVGIGAQETAAHLWRKKGATRTRARATSSVAAVTLLALATLHAT